MRTHSDESASAGGLKQTQFTCNVQIHHKDINGFSSENSEEFTPSVPFYNIIISEHYAREALGCRPVR